MERISGKEKIRQSKMHNISDIVFYRNNLDIKIDNKNYSFDISKISKRLLNASEAERKFYQISPSGYGIHWPAIDEDLSIEGLLQINK